MMSFGKICTAAVVAISMTSAPALAQASSPASQLSVAKAGVRAGAAVEEESALGGGFLIPLLALGAIVLGILVLLDDEDSPESP